MPDFKRLERSIEWSREQLEPFRSHRRAAVREYVGKHYSGNGTLDRVPVNMLWMAVQIYGRNLAARAPQVNVKAKYGELAPAAALFELEINHALDEVKFGKTLRLAVIDALFSVGILKTGLDRSGTVNISGKDLDVGHPFVERVSLDDFVIDMAARCWEEARFVGSLHRVRVEDLLATGLYNDAALREAFQDDNDPEAVFDGMDEGGTERTEQISRSSGGIEFLDKMVSVWEIFLPFERKIVVLPEGGRMGRPLAEYSWEGPEDGPYRILGFSDVPDQVMPLSPIANLIDQHDLINRLYRKSGRQAERQKTWYGVKPGGEEDANRAVQVSDGGVVRMDDPKAINEVSVGGVDQATLAFLLHAKDVFVWLGGNLDLLGGLSPQSDTVGQDAMLQQASSRLAADMKDRVFDFVKGIARDFGWYVWTDPIRRGSMTTNLPGSDIQIQVDFSPETKEGDFLDYNFDIDPYSKGGTTPGEQLAKLRQLMESFVMPLFPLMQAQGVGINLTTLLRKAGKYAGLEELEEIIIYTEPQQPGPQGDPNPKPAVTTRREERVSRIGGTRHGRDSAMIQTLMGAGNPKELAGMTNGGIR